MSCQKRRILAPSDRENKWDEWQRQVQFAMLARIQSCGEPTRIVQPLVTVALVGVVSEIKGVHHAAGGIVFAL